LSALQARLGDRAPLAAAVLMMLSILLFLLPLPHSPAVAIARLAAGILAILLARDVLAHYGPQWREKMRRREEQERAS